MIDEFYFKATNIIINYFLLKEWKFKEASYESLPYENVHLLLDYPNYGPLHFDIMEGKVIIHSLYKLGDYTNEDNLNICKEELNEPGFCLCELEKCDWPNNYDSFALNFEFPVNNFDESNLDDVVCYYRRHKELLDEIMNCTTFKWNRKQVIKPRLTK